MIFNPICDGLWVFLFAVAAVGQIKKLFEGLAHLPLCLLQPILYSILDRYFIEQFNNLVFGRNDLCHIKGLVVSFLPRNSSTGYRQFLYPLKTFLDVLVNFGRVTAVSKQFEEIIVG